MVYLNSVCINLDDSCSGNCRSFGPIFDTQSHLFNLNESSDEADVLSSAHVLDLALMKLSTLCVQHERSSSLETLFSQLSLTVVEPWTWTV